MSNPKHLEGECCGEDEAPDEGMKEPMEYDGGYASLMRGRSPLIQLGVGPRDYERLMKQ